MTKVFLGSSKEWATVLTNTRIRQGKLVDDYQDLCPADKEKRTQARAELKYLQQVDEKDLNIVFFG